MVATPMAKNEVADGPSATTLIMTAMINATNCPVTMDW